MTEERERKFSNNPRKRVNQYLALARQNVKGLPIDGFISEGTINGILNRLDFIKFDTRHNKIEVPVKQIKKIKRTLYEKVAQSLLNLTKSYAVIDSVAFATKERVDELKKYASKGYIKFSKEDAEDFMRVAKVTLVNSNFIEALNLPEEEKPEGRVERVNRYIENIRYHAKGSGLEKRHLDIRIQELLKRAYDSEIRAKIYGAEEIFKEGVRLLSEYKSKFRLNLSELDELPRRRIGRMEEICRDVLS